MLTRAWYIVGDGTLQVADSLLWLLLLFILWTYFNAIAAEESHSSLPADDSTAVCHVPSKTTGELAKIHSETGMEQWTVTWSKD